MSIKVNERLIEAVELIEYEDLRRLVNNLCWEDMEAVLLANGAINYRIEDEIVANLPLKESYWIDTLMDWGIYDENLNSVKENIDEDIVKDFIENCFKVSFLES
ncbi:hypothetical protein [Peptoniphilus timonensis]|uniref:hypothetical protein n=1 Tax=Peptoniphilus timonensis TaxID=1268254 RepID=UPI0002DE5406|nr:hypothetical protein [Peptoniphilus timonensis]